MPNKIKMKDVRAHLELDEPDYAAAAELGPDALPFLDKLLDSKDVMIASKAAYLASVINHSDSVDILQHAAMHADPVVRVAAAAAVRNVDIVDANTVLETLVGDGDAGVRKVAFTNVPDTPSPSLKLKVESAAADETDPDLCSLCNETLIRIGSTPSGSPSDETMTNGHVHTSTEGNDSSDNGGAGMGGGDFDESGTTFSDQAEAQDESGRGGGDFDESDTTLFQRAGDSDEDQDEFGGGDGSLETARGVGDTNTGVPGVESQQGFGGGEF